MNKELSSSEEVSSDDNSDNSEEVKEKEIEKV